MKTAAPTRQQQAAIDARDVSVALSAGAGCGKTSVLTQRFLAHLEPGEKADELSSLVAITFTERAAREMRDRIRAQCRARLREAPSEEVEEWLAIVRELDSARISTIHGFCASLLRSHAVEAGIDPLFNLLDEGLSASFLAKSVKAGLHALLAADDAAAAELVFELGLSRTELALASLVTQRYRIDFSEWDEVTAGELARRWESRWYGEFVPQLLREAAESAAARTVLDLLREHVPDHPVMRERCELLLERIPELPQAENPAALIDELRENAGVRGGGGKGEWEDEDVYCAVRDAFTDFRKLLDKLQEQLEFDEGALLRGAEIGICALRATARVGRFYDERKQEAAVLDFDDLLLRARDLLRDHKDVRRRAAAGIRLLMVDEFQDTDPIQDELVRMLCGDDLLSGRLFIVGDAKQSIYRFRRAEPRVFHQLRGELPQQGRLPLSLNFRSQPEILSFVNMLFDGARGLGPEYEPLEPHAGQLSPTPCIEFLFAVNGADESADEDEQTAAMRRRREADWIARRLAQLLYDGVPRVRYRDAAGQPRLRTAELRDIVILFRAMSDVRYYEEALRKLGLGYYVVGGRAFFAQQEVFDLVNLCHALDDPDDELALVGVLRSPFFSLTDDTIFALGQQGRVKTATARPVGLARAVFVAPPPQLAEQQQQQVRFAAAVLTELREQKDRLPIARLLNMAVERTGYDAALLTEFLGVRKLANLRKLIDMAREFDQSGLFTLGDFVDRLRDAVADETHEPLAATHPESSNVIRLMSIHQSKGLEFPIVVVADLDRKAQEGRGPATLDPQLGPVIGLPDKFGDPRRHPGIRMLRLFERDEDLDESLRVLYVAMTRAADHLILSANLQKAGVGRSPWFRLLSERFDPLTGQPRQAPTPEGASILARYASSIPEIRVHRAAPAPVMPPMAPVARGISLSTLRETLEQAEPGELPETLRPLAPDLAARRRFSVSEIETADQELQLAAGSGPVPPLPPGEGRGEGWHTGLASGTRPAAERKSEIRNKKSQVAFQRLLFDDQPPTAPPPAPAPASSLEAASQLGTLVHAALERADFRNPHDAAALVEICCTFDGGQVDDASRALAAECVANVLASPLREELASARQIHREIEFLLSFPPHTIAGTIDCLFESSRGEWTIIDYKTGTHSEETAAEALLAPYEIQLGLYALAVRQLIQRLPDRIELVYMRHGVERILFEPTEPRLAQITARVERAIRHLQGADRSERRGSSPLTPRDP